MDYAPDKYSRNIVNVPVSSIYQTYVVFSVFDNIDNTPFSLLDKAYTYMPVRVARVLRLYSGVGCYLGSEKS